MRRFQSIFNCTHKDGDLSWWCEEKDKDHPIKFVHWRKNMVLSGAPSFLAEPAYLGGWMSADFWRGSNSSWAGPAPSTSTDSFSQRFMKNQKPPVLNPNPNPNPNAQVYSKL